MAEFIVSMYRKFHRFITFSLIGCINTLVDFAIFTICTAFMHLQADTSQVFGYLAGVICSFLLNHNITFRDGNQKMPVQVVTFVIVNGISLLVSMKMIDFFVAQTWNTYVSKIIVTGITMILNYFGYKFLVFRVKNKEND